MKMKDSADTRFDWSWLADTYWYVPQPDLPALQLPGVGLSVPQMLEGAVYPSFGTQ
jgi:hypothetical protein